MKSLNQFLLGMAFCAILGISFNSCTKKDHPERLPKGKLKLDIGITIVENSGASKLKAGTDDFFVQIFNASNSLVISFPHASDMPDLLELPEGSYYAVASSDSILAVAFENPYYHGNSGTFAITAGQTSSVTITCQLSNIMVTVIYSDRVKSSFANFSTTVSNALDSLVFSKTEARAGFFDAGPLHISSKLYVTGNTLPSKILTGDIANPQPGKKYEIHVDAVPTGGNAMISIALNEIVETEVITITDEGSGTGAPGYGDLLITEIMYNPLALSDAEGEWIEIFNNSKRTINLKGLVIRRGSGTSFHQISSDINLAAGAYAVLGRTNTATNNVQDIYGSAIQLTNSGDEIIVNTFGSNGTDGTVICSVNYGATGFLTNLNGKSLQLDPSIKDVNVAKIGTNWCAATLPYSTGDYGTPGLANSGCH